jgi:hypothetical protein
LFPHQVGNVGMSSSNPGADIEWLQAQTRRGPQGVGQPDRWFEWSGSGHCWSGGRRGAALTAPQTTQAPQNISLVLYILDCLFII